MSSVCLREHIRGRVGWTGVHYVTHPHCVDVLRCCPERAVFKQAFQRKLARSIVPYDAEDGAVQLLVMSHSVVSTCRPCPQHHLNNGIIIHNLTQIMQLAATCVYASPCSVGGACSSLQRSQLCCQLFSLRLCFRFSFPFRCFNLCGLGECAQRFIKIGRRISKPPLLQD